MKQRDISHNRCNQNYIYTYTMYFQGRRNTCNMLRSLKQRQRKEWTSSHKIYQAKCFVGVRYQNVTKLCPPFARCIGSKRFVWICFPIFIYLRLFLPNISLQYKLFRTSSRPMDTQSAIFLFLKEKVCSGYSLEAALSNVNDSFTLSRLMKRPKTCCDPARDEYPQLTFFFREIYRKRFNNV